MDVIPSGTPKMGQRRPGQDAEAGGSGIFRGIPTTISRTVDGVEKSGHVWKEFELVLVVGAEGCVDDHDAWDEAAACELSSSHRVCFQAKRFKPCSFPQEWIEAWQYFENLWLNPTWIGIRATTPYEWVPPDWMWPFAEPGLATTLNITSHYEKYHTRVDLDKKPKGKGKNRQHSQNSKAPPHNHHEGKGGQIGSGRIRPDR